MDLNRKIILGFFLVSNICIEALLLSACAHPVLQKNKQNLMVEKEEMPASFDRIWMTARENIYPKEKALYFTHQAYEELSNQVRPQSTLTDLAEIFNPFLDGLGVSHTHLYVENDPDYYFFRSLFSTHHADVPQVFHIGAQFALDGTTYIVRNILQGYPAEAIGLRRGDKMISVDNQAFQPILSFASGQHPYKIQFSRNGQVITQNVEPVHEAIAESFLRATINSAKLIKVGKKNIGYVQLWTGAFDSDKILAIIMQEKLKDADALILDLRDGFGAAWWTHLDPFFADRSQYWVAHVQNRNGTTEMNRAEPQKNLHYFSRPMVVLINEGVRSGKEALAYQFQKSKRATLIGTKTAGAFVSGKAYFADENQGYLLYLADNGITLDDTQIEGVGVSPDEVVNDPLEPLKVDPQYEAAIDFLSRKSRPRH